MDLLQITAVKYKDQNEQLTWSVKLLKPQQMALQAKDQIKFTSNWFIVNLTEFLLIPCVSLQHGMSFGLAA